MTERLFTIEPEGMPDLPGMMLATLRNLRAMGGSAHIRELENQIIEGEGLSEEEQSYTMRDGARPRANYFLAWARTFLRRGGALENSSRGVWALTAIGERLNGIEECRAIYETVNAEERERARLRRKVRAGRTQDQEAAPSEPPVAPAEATASDDERRGWEEELLAALSAMTPDGFERLSQRLLREAGFTRVEVRGKTGDGGIDGVGVLRVNLVSFQVYFQCKRWKGSVGAREIRDFRGALQGRADKGLFITTGNFTSQAADEATRDGATAIDLIDGERLCRLLKEFELGVGTEMVERVTIDTGWLREQ